MPASVLYFHGFASSPASAKITALRPMLAPDVELNTPDLNAPSFGRLDFEAMVERALDAGRRIPPRAIVGSSLGAVLALEVVRRGLDAPLVLIAPGLGIAERWRTKIPDGDPVLVFNHALAAEAPIHRAFFEQMATVTSDHAAPRVPVTVLMGRRDETVPFDCVQSIWKSWLPNLAPRSKFIELADGDHGLVAYADLIAREIRAAAHSHQED